jgi:hypothetical protein
MLQDYEWVRTVDVLQELRMIERKKTVVPGDRFQTGLVRYEVKAKRLARNSPHHVAESKTPATFRAEREHL